MDVPGVVPESVDCPGCNAPLDLTGQVPFTEIQCAQCNARVLVPSQFGNLLLLNPLGVGGMGTVYKAVDTQLNRYVAVKIVRQKFAGDPQFIETFAREARSAAAVNHPHVAQVYSFGEIDGQYSLTMELLEHGSLDDRITQEKKLPEADVLKIGTAIAGGLRAAYQSQLLHRDIKPGNILFNEEKQPKLVDFGLALAQHEAAVAEGGIIWGTPYYIAPEKLRGQPEDFRSDMYSLGATLFHALAGRPPFDAKTATEVVTKHTTTPALNLKTYNPAVQDFTAQVIGRILAKDPADRYDSYDTLIHDLQEAERRLRHRSTEPVIVTESGESVTLKSALTTWGIVIASLILLVVLWFNRGKLGIGAKPPPPPPPPMAGATNRPAAPAETPATEEINFTEDAPWTKSWSNTVAAIGQQKFQVALNESENLKQLVRGRPRHRQWASFIQGVTLLAAGRGDEAKRSFDFVNLAPRWPAKPTPTNLIEPLAAFMTGDLPAADSGQLPAWAAALQQFLTGLKQYNAGQLDEAGTTFRAFQKLPVDPTQPWVYQLQPLADKIAKEPETNAALLTQITQLQTAGKLDDALKLLRDTRTAARNATFKSQLDQREADILKSQDDVAKKLAEARQAEIARADAERARVQAAAAQAQQQADAEVQRVQAIESTLATALADYDFKTAAGKYEALVGKLETNPGRQALERRRAAFRWLQEFKTQLAADFQAKPVDATKLTVRAGVKVDGKLSRATDTQLIFVLPYGEMQANWRDLTPAALHKLAEAYAPTSPPSARRYVAMLVFAKQYNLNAGTAEAQAVKLDPAMQAEIDAVYGK